MSVSVSDRRSSQSDSVLDPYTGPVQGSSHIGPGNGKLSASDSRIVKTIEANVALASVEYSQ